jgi:hypothetical protein
MILETGSHYVTQVDFELAASSDPPTLLSHVAGTISMCYHTQLTKCC